MRTSARALTALMVGLGIHGPAHALGLGSSVGIGFGDQQGFAPTFDLVLDPAIIQIHALDTLDAVTNEQLYLGANVYFEVLTSPISGAAYGTVQPGFGVDLYSDPTTIVATGEARLGVAAQQEAGFGVYVVPALGIAASEGDADLVIGGTLQFSVWFGGGGGGGTQTPAPQPAPAYPQPSPW